ncbi:MAG: hypothetical protein L3K15_06350 [Thermoplasmata archaeon]|nr:hypothetical protein [Thermoplasmata archaeon]
MESALLGTLQLMDSGGAVLGRFLRDGVGLRALMMNFALQDASGRTLYRVTQPPPRPGIHIGGACPVLNSDGAQIGDLDRHAGLSGSDMVLHLGGREILTTRIPGLTFRPFDVLQGTVPVAHLKPNALSWSGGIHVTFTAAGVGIDRTLVVLFASYCSTFHITRGFPSG